MKTKVLKTLVFELKGEVGKLEKESQTIYIEDLERDNNFASIDD